MFKKDKLLTTELFSDRTNDIKQVSNYFRELLIHISSYSALLSLKNLLNIDIYPDTKEFIFKRANNKKQSLLSYNITEFSAKTGKILNANKYLDYYWGMPEYISENTTAVRYDILFKFITKEDLDYFLTKIDQKITDKTKYLTYPPAVKKDYMEYVYTCNPEVQTKYPLFIVSKGRWDVSYTAKHLLAMGIKFHIIVEQQEYEKYNQYFDKDYLLVLPQEYKDNYDTADPEGDELGLPTGSGPARNFAWDTSIKWGYKYHWVMDDNIDGFFRVNKNYSYEVMSGAFFRSMEEFVDRYKNLSMAGPNYEMFVLYNIMKYPITFNTRIYSCNLIKNDVPFRWRCRYNEDTDLSLRMLKAGYCTALFNSFVQRKLTTQQVKGGNTDTIYKVGTGVKSRALARLHPDCTEVVNRYGRIHHFINYKCFNNKLVYKDNIEIKYNTIDNHNMTLIKREDFNK